MIEVEIPGWGEIALKYLVLDYNGTLAVDGRIIDGVKERLTALAQELEIHVLTADTFGKARAGLKGVPCQLSILPPGGQDSGKRDFVRNLGSAHTVSVGNGRNDGLMLKESALGIAVILGEGAAMETVACGDVIFSDILAALEILDHPLRLTATLRS